MTVRNLARRVGPGRLGPIALLLGSIGGAAGCAERPEEQVATRPAGPPAATASVAPRAARPTPARAEAADIVFHKGRIFTSNPRQPWASAVAIKDGKFVVVGSNGAVRPLIGEGTRVFTIEYLFAMPGLVFGRPRGGDGKPGLAEDPDSLSPAAAWEDIEAEVRAAAEARDASAKPAAGTAGGAAAGGAPGKPGASGAADGEPGDVRERALYEHTIDAARNAGVDGEIGSVEVGKRADFIVLDRHPYFAPVEELSETRVLVGVAGGRIVHEGPLERAWAPAE